MARTIGRHLYIMIDKGRPEWYRIGKANNPEHERIVTLRAGNPALELRRIFWDMGCHEPEVHRAFDDIAGGHDWFYFGTRDAEAEVTAVLQVIWAKKATEIRNYMAGWPPGAKPDASARLEMVRYLRLAGMEIDYIAEIVRHSPRTIANDVTRARLTMPNPKKGKRRQARYLIEEVIA